MLLRRPTMQDVARRAGVSAGTVSRVLAGAKGATSTETAARVKAAAEALGYVVNGVAASLRNRQTSSVGLILADIANPFFGRLASGVEQALAAQGYGVLFANSGNNAEQERRLTRLMMEKQVDALILCSSAASGSHLFDLVDRGLPIVLVDSEVSDVAGDSVVVDNAGAARSAVDHLIALGHRNIAIITGQLAASFDQDRLSGYQQALLSHDLPVFPSLIGKADSTFEGGQRAALALLKRDPRPTALFVTNNLMSMGAITALVAAGVSIPDAMSFIGFDDMEWYPIFKPSITAIAQPSFRIGQVAAERLLERFASERRLAPRRVVLQTELIVRNSTAACPGP